MCGMQDETELEVFDNWEGQPGAAVMAGGQSSTRESKWGPCSRSSPSVLSLHAHMFLVPRNLCSQPIHPDLNPHWASQLTSVPLSLSPLTGHIGTTVLTQQTSQTQLASLRQHSVTDNRQTSVTGWIMFAGHSLGWFSPGSKCMRWLFHVLLGFKAYETAWSYAAVTTGLIQFEPVANLKLKAPAYISKCKACIQFEAVSMFARGYQKHLYKTKGCPCYYTWFYVWVFNVPGSLGGFTPSLRT